MLTRNRLYVRKEPDKDARLFIVFCEGEKTEPNYFKYFNGINSQIKIIILPHIEGRNSPKGLYDNACEYLIKTEEREALYEINDEDKIWFLIDTDSWGEQINVLRENCATQINWNIAQSNPCFEVWLYYHLNENKAQFQGLETSQNWKQHLNDTIGGFNPNKHPIFIEKAIENSKSNYHEDANTQPSLASTQVFLLAEQFLPLIKKDIDEALKLI